MLRSTSWKRNGRLRNRFSCAVKRQRNLRITVKLAPPYEASFPFIPLLATLSTVARMPRNRCGVRYDVNRTRCHPTERTWAWNIAADTIWLWARRLSYGGLTSIHQDRLSRGDVASGDVKIKNWVNDNCQAAIQVVYLVTELGSATRRLLRTLRNRRYFYITRQSSRAIRLETRTNLQIYRTQIGKTNVPISKA